MIKILSPRRSILFLFLFLASCFCIPQTAKSASVELEWRIIAASHAKGNVDPRLKDIYRDLGAFFNYNSYTLLNMNRVRLAQGQPVSVPLPEGKTCLIQLKEVTAKWIHIQIQITRNGRSLFGTTARLKNGRMLLLGGPSSKGKALIFSLRSFW